MLNINVLDKLDPDHWIFYILFYDHVEFYTIFFLIGL